VTAAPPAAALARAIEQRDHVRRSGRAVHGECAHKEWLHFAVYGQTVDLIVNFSLVEDVAPRAPLGAELAYLTCLVRDDAWDGDVELCASQQVRAPGGQIALELGQSSVRFADGCYRVRAVLSRRPIEIDLVLEPLVFPLETHNVVIDGRPALNWVVVPRLRATGVVRVGERVHALRAAQAYHDHNWGRFAWGRSFAWEWGYVLPRASDNPYSLAFVRLSDRGRRRVSMQGVFLWRGDRQARLFRDAQVALRCHGFLRPEAPFKVPRISNLVNPGSASDVPERLVLSARDGGDWLRLEFASQHVAQLAIPNDRDLGLTVIQEVLGEAVVTGELRGEPIAIEGRSICEFLGD
jgi:hypothetical protein